MHVRLCIAVPRIRRGIDVYVMPLPDQLPGKRLHRHHDAIHNRVVALGEQSNAHALACRRPRLDPAPLGGGTVTRTHRARQPQRLTVG